MMKKNTFSLVIFLLLGTFVYSQNSNFFDVRQFGADGRKDNLVTEIIRQTIDKCSEAGGGIVYFPPGDYLMGRIDLKDNITLHLEAGATIWASRDTNDYKSDKSMKKSYEGGEAPSGDVPVLIYAYKAKNISIVGKGTIYGGGERVLEPLKAVDPFTREETENARKAGVDLKMYYKVPPFTNMVIFDDCENITVQDVSMIESASWTLHFKWCRKVYVERVNIASSLENGVNADGIDVDGCKDVLINNCIVKTGDDAIVLKTTRTPDGKTQSCENVIVTNCSVTSTDSGLKLGTESYGDYRHIVFSNCIIRNTNRALSIIVRDGATVSDVLYSDISIECNRKYYFWWGNGDPIWLVVRKRKPESKIGTIKNIMFRNIMAHAQGTSRIEGFEGAPLENITFSDCQIFMEPEAQPDKRAYDAFYAHDVNELSLHHVSVKWNTGKTEPLWRHAFLFENINGLHLDQLKGSQAPTGTGAMIALNNVEKAIIERCQPGNDNTLFLRIDGSKTKAITLNDNYVTNLDKNISKGKGVVPNSVLVK